MLSVSSSINSPSQDSQGVLFFHTAHIPRNSRLPVGPLELPLLGLVVEKDVDETSFVRALQLLAA